MKHLIKYNVSVRNRKKINVFVACRASYGAGTNGAEISANKTFSFTNHIKKHNNKHNKCAAIIFNQTSDHDMRKFLSFLPHFILEGEAFLSDYNIMCNIAYSICCLILSNLYFS